MSEELTVLMENRTPSIINGMVRFLDAPTPEKARALMLSIHATNALVCAMIVLERDRSYAFDIAREAESNVQQIEFWQQAGHFQLPHVAIDLLDRHVHVMRSWIERWGRFEPEDESDERAEIAFELCAYMADIQTSLIDVIPDDLLFQALMGIKDAAAEDYGRKQGLPQ